MDLVTGHGLFWRSLVHLVCGLETPEGSAVAALYDLVSKLGTSYEIQADNHCSGRLEFVLTASIGKQLALDFVEGKQ